MFRLTFTADFKNLQGRFAKADEELLNNQRESVRVLGRRWVQIARQEAPVGKKKDIRRKQTLRESIHYRTFIDGKTIGFKGYTQQPLGKYVIEGTAPHRIQAKNKEALYFLWDKIGRYVLVPRYGKGITENRGDLLVIGKGYVDHPGTKPNPFTTRTAQGMVVEYGRELNRIANQWVMTFGA